MNKDIFEHALVAIAIQAVIGWRTGNWWTGAALASGYFIGREVAQAEYRWIEQFGEGLRANLPWGAVFDRRIWQNPDQIMDWLGPIMATSGIAIGMSRRKGSEDKAAIRRP